MLKKVLSVIICSLMFLSVGSINAFAEQGESLSGGQLLKQYVLEDNINKDINATAKNTVEEMAAANAMYIQSYVNTNNTAKETYGGCYIDDNSQLHVLFTKNAKSDMINTVEKMTENSVISEECKYSLCELMSLKEQISDALSSRESDDIKRILNNIVSVGVYEQYNKVIVRMKNCDNEKISLFKKLISNSDAILFENSAGCEKKALLYTGSQIVVATSANNLGYSIGFRCQYLSKAGNYYNGFATAAHSNSAGDEVFYNNVNIGYIMYRRNGGKVDVAFVCVTNSNYTLTNTMHRGLGTLASGKYVATYNVGKTVYMVGGSSAYKSGSIISTSVDTYPDESEDDQTIIRDCVETSYVCRAGDSGGVVYRQISGSNYVTGLNMAAITNDNGVETSSVFVKINNIKDVCNITLY